jgi:glycerol-3-phosphate dehydrogenase
MRLKCSRRFCRRCVVGGRGGSAAGGDLPGDFASFLADVGRRWPFLPAEVAGRMAHAYGTRITRILGDAASLADLGQDFGHGFMRPNCAI